MDESMRERLKIPYARLDEINAVLLKPDMRVVNDVLAVVEKYGTVEEINRQAAEAAKLPNLLEKVKSKNSEYMRDLDWLIDQRDKKVFISIPEYRRKILGDKSEQFQFMDDFAVTLEISATQYFPWLMEIARRSKAEQMLMPGRYIKVRKMKEQENDGDLPAIAAAMQIIGAS